MENPARPTPRNQRLRRARPARRAVVGALLALALPCVVSCNSSPGDQVTDPPSGEGIVLTEIAAVSGSLTGLTAPPGDPRLFIVEQQGRIRIIQNGSLVATPFLDIRSLTTAQGERGLLGLTFHPQYASNGRFFVNYTNVDGDTRVAEYRVSSDPQRADANSAAIILSVGQPFSNHNGGDLAFGPDGMLYVAMGDGGGSNDPLGNGQDVLEILGKLLRLDVSTPGQARIPAGNPFAGRPQDGREEIWAWGLRNPWRISFDAPTGLLYIADVGQGAWEEVNVMPAGEAGVNYGWDIMEGPDCLEGGSCSRAGLTEPTLAYPHPQGCSVIGGAVYRGTRIPEVVGHYFYSDLCGRFLRSFRYDDGQAESSVEWSVEAPDQVSSMGRDSAGELYVLTVDGKVLRVDPE